MISTNQNRRKRHMFSFFVHGFQHPVLCSFCPRTLFHFCIFVGCTRGIEYYAFELLPGQRWNKAIEEKGNCTGPLAPRTLIKAWSHVRTQCLMRRRGSSKRAIRPYTRCTVRQCAAQHLNDPLRTTRYCTVLLGLLVLHGTIKNGLITRRFSVCNMAFRLQNKYGES